MTFRLAICLFLAAPLLAAAQEKQPKKDAPKETKDVKEDKNRLPITKLAPAKLFPNLCLVKYRVTTNSPECQAYFDQGLGYFYSYVWMEAARSFETAAKHDPDCAMAWWGLSRAIERWGKGQQADSLKKAQDLLHRCSHRENLLITARLYEKGMAPDSGDTEKRKQKALETIDTLLTLYEDDEEGWIARAFLAGGGGGFGGKTSSAPFYKALLKYNPLHPGAHHELVHHFENIRRPALGWPHAELYIKSSPGLPHAFHMQAHLGMRIGRWEQTTDWSSHAIELEKAYHEIQGVKPSEDSQYAHHLETLIQALIHDGRYQEARLAKKEGEINKYNNHRLHWFRLHLYERDWDAAAKVIEQDRKSDKATTSYLRAVLYLSKGELERAGPEVAVLQETYQGKRSDKVLELRLLETQGWLLCQQGAAPAGLKLLAKTVEKTKDDFKQHAWGHGAYYMERWGIAALQAGKLDVAEEAFLEAIAHDNGSARGALGMQVICERQGRTEAAVRFADLAQRCWHKADSGCLETELAALRNTSATSTGGASSDD